MIENIAMAILGAATVFSGVGWYTTARAARTMARIHLAMIKGMDYTTTGLFGPGGKYGDDSDDEEDNEL